MEDNEDRGYNQVHSHNNSQYTENHQLTQREHQYKVKFPDKRRKTSNEKNAIKWQKTTTDGAKGAVEFTELSASDEENASSKVTTYEETEEGRAEK